MKYKLVKHNNSSVPRHLYQIKALIDIPMHNVRKGALGGYVEIESNLSQQGNAWVSGNAWVCGNARVSGNALVSGNAQIYGNAQVFNDAQVFGDAQVFDRAKIYDNALVCDNAWVYEHAQIYSNAEVSANARIRNYDEIDHIDQYVCIQGFKYPITVTCTSIHVGCVTSTPDELDNDYTELSLKGGINEETRDRMKLIIETALEQVLSTLD
jgi:carbonic anhydrase/acetyltransferase-like protein (isoleucine patch superfamily)